MFIYLHISPSFYIKVSITHTGQNAGRTNAFGFPWGIFLRVGGDLYIFLFVTHRGLFPALGLRAATAERQQAGGGARPADIPGRVLIRKRWIDSPRQREQRLFSPVARSDGTLGWGGGGVESGRCHFGGSL